MLLGKTKTVHGRIWSIVFATLGVTAAGVLLAAAGGAVGAWPWPPQPSSRFGVFLGVVGGLIVGFEMLILPRKWLRGWRLFNTTWMK